MMKSLWVQETIFKAKYNFSFSLHVLYIPIKICWDPILDCPSQSYTSLTKRVIHQVHICIWPLQI